MRIGTFAKIDGILIVGPVFTVQPMRGIEMCLAANFYSFHSFFLNGCAHGRK